MGVATAVGTALDMAMPLVTPATARGEPRGVSTIVCVGKTYAVAGGAALAELRFQKKGKTVQRRKANETARLETTESTVPQRLLTTRASVVLT